MLLGHLIFSNIYIFLNVMPNDLDFGEYNYAHITFDK